MPIFVGAMPKRRCSPATFVRPVTFPSPARRGVYPRRARLRAHYRSLACAVARAGFNGTRRRSASRHCRGVGNRCPRRGQRHRLDLAARDRDESSGGNFRAAYWLCRGARSVIERRIMAALALARIARAVDRIGAKSGGSRRGGIRGLLRGARRIQRSRATIDVDVVLRRARGAERPPAGVFAGARVGAGVGAVGRSMGGDGSGILVVVLRGGGHPVRDCIAWAAGIGRLRGGVRGASARRGALAERTWR